MAHTFTFDTLRYSKKLIDAGLPSKIAEAQAEAQLEIFSEIAETNLASKQDLADAKFDIIK